MFLSHSHLKKKINKSCPLMSSTAGLPVQGTGTTEHEPRLTPVCAHMCARVHHVRLFAVFSQRFSWNREGGNYVKWIQVKHENLLHTLHYWDDKSLKSQICLNDSLGTCFKDFFCVITHSLFPLFCSCLCSSFPQPVNWQEAEFTVCSNYSTKNRLLL